MIVPFAAGGPTDTLARILARRMTVKLGQSIVVEDMSGASGSIGVGRVARSSPDGYTLSIGNISTHVFNGVIYPLPYDLRKDFEPIAMSPAIRRWFSANARYRPTRCGIDRLDQSAAGSGSDRHHGERKFPAR